MSNKTNTQLVIEYAETVVTFTAAQAAEATGLENKQVMNAIGTLKKMGELESTDRGVYAQVIKDEPEEEQEQEEHKQIVMGSHYQAVKPCTIEDKPAKKSVASVIKPSGDFAGLKGATVIELDEEQMKEFFTMVNEHNQHGSLPTWSEGVWRRNQAIFIDTDGVLRYVGVLVNSSKAAWFEERNHHTELHNSYEAKNANWWRLYANGEPSKKTFPRGSIDAIIEGELPKDMDKLQEMLVNL
ncbi:hypothetical protein [Vibrio sp. ER1A]|uniref:hypothetical protein n=1 Tax=Vibrio sp. ER1A TaxID=1517681 RepID=UPI0004DD5751|nr:hypothetical protein [Vibrio sp. ER1A]KFA99387.1 hypothetical protein HW45_04120 [Vibrio sp. ER1A]